MPRIQVLNTVWQRVGAKKVVARSRANEVHTLRWCLDDRIPVPLDDVGFVAGPAGQKVLRPEGRAAIEDVVAFSSVQAVTPSVSQQLVITRPAREQVIAGIAHQGIVASARIYRVVAAAGIDDVVLISCVNEVVIIH
ncbi:MAG: hypothetical protein V5B35_01000 [Candidatus Accumulibacter necessarius]